MATLLDYAIPNLLINGGFEEETPDGFDPVCWTVLNGRATSSIVLAATASCPTSLSVLTSSVNQANYWTRVIQPQRYPGYRSFIRAVIQDRANAFAMTYDLFTTRLAQTLARSSPPIVKNSDYGTPPTLAPYFDQFRGEGTPLKAFAGLDVDDRDITISLSFLVENGVGDIEVFLQMMDASTGTVYEFGPDPANPTADKVVVANHGVVGPAWERVGKAFRTPRVGYTFPGGPAIVADDPILGFGIRCTRLSEQGAFIVYLSAVSLVVGDYAGTQGVPYNGDLSYLLDPRYTIRPTFGELPPPGFRKLVDLIEEDIDGRFPVMTSENPVPLQFGGSETHTHEMGDTIMNVRSVLKGAENTTVANDRTHSHEITEALNAPTSRSILLCIKL